MGRTRCCHRVVQVASGEEEDEVTKAVGETDSALSLEEKGMEEDD